MGWETLYSGFHPLVCYVSLCFSVRVARACFWALGSYTVAAHQPGELPKSASLKPCEWLHEKRCRGPTLNYTETGHVDSITYPISKCNMNISSWFMINEKVNYNLGRPLCRDVCIAFLTCSNSRWADTAAQLVTRTYIRKQNITTERTPQSVVEGTSYVADKCPNAEVINPSKRFV